MGMMGNLIARGVGGGAGSVGAAVTGVAEVFVGNRAAREAAEQAAFTSTVSQYGAEFATVRASRFDGFMNGLNRLPRPLMVIGTLALFVYAMFAPAGFSVRMQGLALVPEPLWWLLGAIVSFYFGARELHYRREAGVVPVLASAQTATASKVTTVTDAAEVVESVAARATLDVVPEPAPLAAPEPGTVAPDLNSARAVVPDFNAAIEEWRQQRA